MTAAAAPFAERRYDLYLSAGRKRFSFRNTDHGVTLTPDGIAWTADDTDDAAPFSNIRAVHLQSSGDWKNALNTCTLTFADGHRLVVHDGNSFGTADEAQTPLYAGFVRDLHARLARSADGGAVAYTSGYTQGRYTVLLVSSCLLGIIALPLPLVLFLLTGDIKALFIAIGGAWMAWPLYKMVKANAPRSYAPDALPQALME
jgi:hypothetical protein